MRSSTLFFAASVFAIASPALASRRGSAYSRDETSALYQREDMDLLARELMERGFWKDFGNGFVKGFTGTVKTLAPIATAVLKREDLEMLGNEIHKQAKGDDQAEALSWQDVDHFFHGAGQVIQSITPVVQAAAPHFKGKRELTDAIYSRLARDLHDDIKARGFWTDFGHGFVKGFTGTVKTLAPVVKAVLKREELEMLAREIQSRELQDDVVARSMYDLD